MLLYERNFMNLECEDMLLLYVVVYMCVLRWVKLATI
jgi:hypothetical protein